MYHQHVNPRWNSGHQKQPIRVAVPDAPYKSHLQPDPSRHQQLKVLKPEPSLGMFGRAHIAPLRAYRNSLKEKFGCMFYFDISGYVEICGVPQRIFLAQKFIEEELAPKRDEILKDLGVEWNSNQESRKQVYNSGPLPDEHINGQKVMLNKRQDDFRILIQTSKNLSILGAKIFRDWKFQLEAKLLVRIWFPQAKLGQTQVEIVGSKENCERAKVLIQTTVVENLESIVRQVDPENKTGYFTQGSKTTHNLPELDHNFVPQRRYIQPAELLSSVSDTITANTDLSAFATDSIAIKNFIAGLKHAHKLSELEFSKDEPNKITLTGKPENIDTFRKYVEETLEPQRNVILGRIDPTLVLTLPGEITKEKTPDPYESVVVLMFAPADACEKILKSKEETMDKVEKATDVKIECLFGVKQMNFLIYGTTESCDSAYKLMQNILTLECDANEIQCTKPMGAKLNHSSGLTAKIYKVRSRTIEGFLILILLKYTRI